MEAWGAQICVYVYSLIMKTKSCCSCSEGFVLLMRARGQPIQHLCAREKVDSCVYKAKCVAFYPLSVTHSLIAVMTAVRLVPGDEWEWSLFPLRLTLSHTLGSLHESRLLAIKSKTRRKLPSKESKTKWHFFFSHLSCYVFKALPRFTHPFWAVFLQLKLPGFPHGCTAPQHWVSWWKSVSHSAE